MVSRFFRYDHASNSVVEVSRRAEAGMPRYPLPLEVLAVHPAQIHQQRELDRAMGVPTDYQPDGSPVMRDAGHYRRYRKAHGYHFRNGYES